MLKVGTLAPEIDAVDHLSRSFRLSDRSGRLCTVAFFFPKAFTPGCTREATSFRDSHNELLLLGASVVGISTDDAATQCRFADSVKAPFPMIADAEGGIARAFDVRWPLLGLAQRVTYILAPSRRVLAAFHSEFDITRHRNDVLHFVDELSRQRRAGDG